MRKGSILKEGEDYLYSALIASFAVHGTAGFKASQYKFFTELLSNWMSSFYADGGLFLQNTQISRALDYFVSQGLVNKGAGKNKGLYFLTRGGMVDALYEVVRPAPLDKLDIFFFKYHFVTFYRKLVFELIDNELENYPRSFRVELESLFDRNNLLQAQRKVIDYEVNKLQKRIKESQSQYTLTQTLHNEGRSLNSIVKEIEQKYPYELNGQKGMSELFSQLSYSLKYLEIMEAPKLRVETLWKPTLKYLEHFLKQLESLESIE